MTEFSYKNVIIFFFSRKDAPDIPYNLTVTDSRNKTTTVNYVLDTLSNLNGWMVLLMDKETYVLTFDNTLVSKQLQVTWEIFYNFRIIFGRNNCAFIFLGEQREERMCEVH